MSSVERHLLMLVSLAALCPVGAWSQPVVHVWSHGYGGSDFETGGDVATDSGGNVVVVGTFRGTLNLGGSALVGVGGLDIFVAKYDPFGNHLWSKRFGNVDDDWGRGVVIDDDDNVLITGSIWGEVDFGGGPKIGGDYYDVFVAKFDASGNHVWSHAFGSGADDGGRDIAVDSGGNVAITGSCRGVIDFGGGGAGPDFPITTPVLAEFDADGNHMWSHVFEGANSEGSGGGVAFDAGGDVIVTGQFMYSVDFGGGALVADENGSAFLARFDDAGNHIWSYVYGGSGSDAGTRVHVDNAGNISLIGFGVGPLSAAEHNMFLSRLDGDGVPVWTKNFDEVSAEACVADNYGIFVTGSLTGTVDFGGGPLTTAGDRDIFVALFDLNGNHIWSKHYGGANDEESGTGVAMTSSGNLLFTGSYRDPVDFGGGVIQNGGLPDVFVVELDRTTVATAITSFDVSETMAGARLTGTFSSNLMVSSIRVYRADAEDNLARFLGTTEPAADSFEYVDETIEPGRIYRYFVGVVDGDGEFFSPTLALTTRAQAIALEPNQPNPFNPQTAIPFTLDAQRHVTIQIFDTAGRMVTTLLDETRRAGRHHMTWNGTDARGSTVSSGVYFCRLRADNVVRSRRLVLIK